MKQSTNKGVSGAKKSAPKKTTGSFAGPAPKKTPSNNTPQKAAPKKTGITPGSMRPSPEAAAKRDVLTNKTGQGSGAKPAKVKSEWQKAYDLAYAREKRKQITPNGQGTRSTRKLLPKAK